MLQSVTSISISGLRGASARGREAEEREGEADDVKSFKSFRSPLHDMWPPTRCIIHPVCFLFCPRPRRHRADRTSLFQSALVSTMTRGLSPQCSHYIPIMFFTSWYIILTSDFIVKLYWFNSVSVSLYFSMLFYPSYNKLNKSVSMGDSFCISLFIY